MWLNIALFAAILWQCNSMDMDCNNIFSESLYGVSECFQEDSEAENEEVMPCDEVETTNILWTVMDTKSGTVAVEFNLMPKSCGYTSYRLDLYMDEKVTNAEECANRTLFPSRHSRRYAEILSHDPENNKNISPCGKTAEVKFNYVFSGCYKLQFALMEDGIPDKYSESLPQFVETEYRKDLLVKKIPRITRQYTTTLHQIDVSVQFQAIEEFEDLHMSFRLNSDIDQSKDRACYESGHEHSCCIYRTSGKFMCKVKNKLTNKPICHIGKDEIRCTIQNVTAGYYCVLVEIFDDRCVRDTVWNNDSYCVYNSKVFEVQSVSPQSPQITSPPSLRVDVILMAVFAVFVLMCIFALIFIWRRRRRRRSSEPDESRHVMKRALPLRPRILLLYSRDCKPFMNMMATFREMLKQVMKCEVYDCFDPLVEEELYQSKTDWLTTRVTCPEVKVVVVESKCAVLHQIALIKHVKLLYKEPTWLDDLFSYGLRILREDLQKNTYGRVFVVRIHGFTEEDDNICHITPYTRYVVPQNTEKLLSSLYQQSSLEYVLILNENTDSSLQKLKEDIRTLEIFKERNRDYLNKLFEKDIKEFIEETELKTKIV
ncbi:uncharacterized protein LOC111873394 isoform X2 [Cryptotermes secundus]|uniref:uncharacterized protein LOC111873394 isoform X2 n=1 Tax=Cryptotermes secundus TaxID=105785 RepID=UPI000CD7B288|nr:uncharacterized protein LOC111873394 isoform X2 [Cryptotermes secundus]